MFSASQKNCADGSDPVQGLIEGSDGNFYGSTSSGGPGLYGTSFKLTPSGARTTLHNFCAEDYPNCTDGIFPSMLIEGSDGNFYGTAYGMGPNTNGGTVFRLTPQGALTTLYNFCSVGGIACTDGSGPSNLVQGTDGNFYGVTAYGGTSSLGTIFKITPAGKLTTLASFNEANGQLPYNGLVEGPDGGFYSVAIAGGTGSFEGTVFKVSSAGTLTALYSFCSANGTTCPDGINPEGQLIWASDGNLYGTTDGGGANDAGTVFKITPSGELTTLYNLCSQGGTDCSDGSYPQGGLVQGADGNFLGIATQGGLSSSLCDITQADSGCGVVFGLTVNPSLPGPVQLSVSESQIDSGGSFTLSWKVLNAFSTTLQQCYAHVQGSAPGAGTWSGKQTGTYSSTTQLYTGTAAIAPTVAGTYTYALTCGGLESGFATVTMLGASSDTSLIASPTAVTVGQQVTLKALVTTSGVSPTGKVTFTVDGTELGSASVDSSGLAILAASSNEQLPGKYPVIAIYSGDSSHDGSTSPAVNVELSKAPTLTILTVSPLAVTPPQDATLTAAVSRSASGSTGVPTGTVTFASGSVILATVRLNNAGVAVLTASSKGYSSGTYPITAKYSGDGSDTTSTSSAAAVTVK